MPWSTKKLNSFYETTDGINIKRLIQNEINNIIKDKKKHSDVCCFGYDIMDGQYNFFEQINNQQKFDFIVSCHCEETSHPFQDLISFCNNHLKENGFCLLITPNGNGYWNCKNTPFCRYRSYQNIKALKRIHFKILGKKPILCLPVKILSSKFKATYQFCDKICKLLTPASHSGAYIITAQKKYILEENKETITRNIKFFNKSQNNKALV